MELDKILEQRKSARSYLEKPVSRGLLTKLIDAALLAPSSCNLQLNQYIILDDKELLSDFSKNISYKFSYAPACLLLLYDPRFTVERASVVSSAAMAAENILLKAVDLGLATCPMAGFEKDEKIKKKLGIPQYMSILLIVSVGYPAENVDFVSRSRVEASSVLRYNSYGDMRSINDSAVLKDHSMEDLIEYRRRISTVYLDRFRLNTYSEQYYNIVLDWFKHECAERGVKKVIDIISYDGIFIKNLHEKMPEFDLTSADYLQTNLDFFNKKFFCKTCLLRPDSTFAEKTEDKYDAATLIFQAEFHPDLQMLLPNTHTILKKSGFLLVAIVQENIALRFARVLKSLYRRILLGKLDNIYEGNPFYKIGPRTNLSDHKIRNLFKQSNFLLKKNKKVNIGRGRNISMFILHPSSSVSEQNK